MGYLVGLLAGLTAAVTVIDNDFVLVTRGGAPCAEAGRPGCAERVLVALGPVAVGAGSEKKELERGDVLVFGRGVSYTPPLRGDYVEVALKPRFPPVPHPGELIPPEKNTLLYDGKRFFVFEEKLDPGDVRPRHSHSARVVVVLNKTRLQQWPDGAPEVFKHQVPDTIKFNAPVIHVVKTVGEAPLRNIVIELKPKAGEGGPTR